MSGDGAGAEGRETTGGHTEPAGAEALEPVPVVAAVIRREGRYLLGRRPGHKRHGGLWEFPGGKLHDGEDAEAAAHRELDEELALAPTRPSCGRAWAGRRRPRLPQEPEASRALARPRASSLARLLGISLRMPGSVQAPRPRTTSRRATR